MFPFLKDIFYEYGFSFLQVFSFTVMKILFYFLLASTVAMGMPDVHLIIVLLNIISPCIFFFFFWLLFGSLSYLEYSVVSLSSL